MHKYRDDKYSLINRARVINSNDGYTLDEFYAALTGPAGFITGLLVVATVIYKDLLEQFSLMLKGDVNAKIYLYMLAFTFFLGIRLIHSIRLAKIDYQNIKGGFFDIVIVIFVIFFTSGGILSVFKYFWDDISGLLLGEQGELNYLVVVFFIYAVGGIVGFLNSVYLYSRRIPEGSLNFDYLTERNIQYINAIVFLFLAAIFVFLSFDLYFYHQFFPKSGLLFSLCSILVLLNLVHSELCTFRPKFLVNDVSGNIDELVDSVAEAFQEFNIFSSNTEIKAGLVNSGLLDQWDGKSHKLKLVRASKSDAALIASELYKHFGYMFHYLFGDGKELQGLLEKLICCSRGNGVFGYLHARLIVNSDNEVVGLIYLDTWHSNWLYSPWKELSQITLLVRYMGIFSFSSALKKFHKIIKTQKKVSINELRVSYFVVLEPFLNQGIGRSVLYLLKNSVLKHHHELDYFEKISLIVRKKNTRARKLFKNVGFKESQNEIPNIECDPFIENDNLGEPVYCTLMST